MVPREAPRGAEVIRTEGAGPQYETGTKPSRTVQSFRQKPAEDPEPFRKQRRPSRPSRLDRRSTRSKLGLCVACGAAAVASNKRKEPDPRVGVYTPLRFQQPKEEIMPLLIPILIGVPVVFGGGWVIYHFVH
jgi:hypothetical protein